MLLCQQHRLVLGYSLICRNHSHTCGKDSAVCAELADSGRHLQDEEKVQKAFAAGGGVRWWWGRRWWWRGVHSCGRVLCLSCTNKHTRTPRHERSSVDRSFYQKQQTTQMGMDAAESARGFQVDALCWQTISVYTCIGIARDCVHMTRARTGKVPPSSSNGNNTGIVGCCWKHSKWEHNTRRCMREAGVCIELLGPSVTDEGGSEPPKQTNGQ